MVVVNPIPTATLFKSQLISFRGIVQSLGENLWTINGILVDVRKAEISGIPEIGVVAKAEGYFDQNGVFIAKRIELPKKSPGDDSNVIISPSATPDSSQSGDDDHHDDKHDNEHDHGPKAKTPEPQH